MSRSKKWTTAKEVIENAENIAFYERVSTKEQHYNGQQAEIVSRYLNRLGKPMTPIQHKDKISAYTQPYSKREEFKNLIDTFKKENYDALIVSDRDRLSRQTEEHFRLREEFNRAGIPVVIASQNELYNTESFLKNLIEDALTKMESDNISVRTKATLTSKVLNKEYIGGHPPFGYEMVKNEDGKVEAFKEKIGELSLVRQIFSDYLNGETFAGIANKLKKKSQGIKWSASKVRTIILNPIYAGAHFYNRYNYKGKKRSFKPIDQWISFSFEKVKVDAAISLEDWWICWQKYESQKDYPPRYHNTSFYFFDRLVCSCGSKKFFGKDGRTNITNAKKGEGKSYGKRWYVCDECDRKIEADELHTEFFDFLFGSELPDDLILDELSKAIQNELNKCIQYKNVYESQIASENKNLDFLNKYLPKYERDDFNLEAIKNNEVVAYYLSKMHSKDAIETAEEKVRLLEMQAKELRNLLDNESRLQKLIGNHFNIPEWRELSKTVLRNITLFIVEGCTILDSFHVSLKIKGIPAKPIRLKN